MRGASSSRVSALGVLRRVGERRELPAQLVVLADPLPDRAHDVHHLPVRDPFARGALTLLALTAGDGPLHRRLDARLAADRDVGLHAALPQREVAVDVRRVDRPAHPVLVDPHVPVGHRDRVDVGVDESGVPGVGVGDRVDVVPAAGVEADEVDAERGADLHQLKARLDLLDEHVTEDRSALAGRGGPPSVSSRRLQYAASAAVWIFGR